MNKTYVLPLAASVLALSFASQNAFATCAEIKAAGNLKAVASVIVPADPSQMVVLDYQCG